MYSRTKTSMGYEQFLEVIEQWEDRRCRASLHPDSYTTFAEQVHPIGKSPGVFVAYAERETLEHIDT